MEITVTYLLALAVQGSVILADIIRVVDTLAHQLSAVETTVRIAIVRVASTIE